MSASPSQTTKTKIEFYDKSLGKIRDELLDAIGLANNPPFIFQSGGQLVRLKRVEARIHIQQLDLDMLRSAVDQAAIFVRKLAKDRERIEAPPIDTIRDLFCQAEWPDEDIPFLDAVVRCPVFAKDGQLIQTRGFHRGSRIFVDPEVGLERLDVPQIPSEEDIRNAIASIEEMLHDFSFADNASRANAYALLLSPFCRHLIGALIPMFILEAPTPGSGKGLLVACLTIVFLGMPCSASAPPKDEDEWRKSITSHLRASPAFVLYDNVSGVLHARSLEHLLTASEWTDRILGTNDLASLKNQTIWIATGNNLEASGDLPRRLVWIRLDTQMERPDERPASDFRHPDILGWISKNRTEVVRACLILVQSWLAKGKPPWSRKIGVGSFQAWAETLGGILENVGIEGFLANAQKKRLSTDDDSDHARKLCQVWFEYYADKAVGVAKLFDIVQEFELFPRIFLSESPQGQRQKFGHILKKLTDRVFGAFRIENAGEDNSRRATYVLKVVDEDKLVVRPAFGDPEDLDFDHLLPGASTELTDDTIDHDDLESQTIA